VPYAKVVTVTCPVPAGARNLRAYADLRAGGNGTRYWSELLPLTGDPRPLPMACQVASDRLPGHVRARSGFDVKVHFTCDQPNLVRAWEASMRVALRPERVGGTPTQEAERCVADGDDANGTRWTCSLPTVGVYDIRPVLRANTTRGPLIVQGQDYVLVVLRADTPELPSTQPQVLLFDVPAAHAGNISFQLAVNWRAAPPTNSTVGAWLGTSPQAPTSFAGCGAEVPTPVALTRLTCAAPGNATVLRGYVRIAGGNSTAVHWSEASPLRRL
jgi:hypothetical protein